MEKVFKLFMLSINSIFDIIINYSKSFVDIRKDLLKDEQILYKYIDKLYSNLCSNTMKQFDNILEIPKSINKDLIKILISNNAMLYNCIFNKMISHTINKNLSVSFRKKVLEDNSDAFRQILSRYISNMSNLNYREFIKDIKFNIKINNHPSNKESNSNTALSSALLN